MSTSSVPRPPRPARLLAGLAAALASLLVLAACGGSSSDSGADASGAGSGDYQPVSIKHAFGTTTFDEAPKRIATWGWGSTDAALALAGDDLVAMPAQSYAGDKQGVLPWVKEYVASKDLTTPTVLTEGDEPPYEELIKAKPDVIFANYSGTTKEQYTKLSKIAKTVAYPGEAWSTPWRDVVKTVGQVLGKSAQADKLLADVDAKVKAAGEAHPEFQGKTIAAVADAAGTFYVYKPADPRVQFLEDLGFTSAPSVEKLQTKESTFFSTISREKTDQLTSDVLLSYSDDQKQADAFDQAASTKAMGQYKSGAIAQITGPSLVSSVSPPTILSLDYSLDEFVGELSKAAKQAS